MNNRRFCCLRRMWPGAVAVLAWAAISPPAHANPTGGNVTQGTASISSSGPQLTINQTSGNAFINWQTFNIAPGETTVFNQPSASSVTWNFIGDPNASSINGNLSANGLVVLQNPHGFTVGGSATIAAHGLIMTTARTPGLDLSGGGAWSFDAPPPTAKIINYGKIDVTGGGSAFLIASDIENSGTISAAGGGRVGLYAGQKVLVSTAPDGRGLSAEVTLPQGSVDNTGHLIADGGSIAAQAQVVNQSGVIQANSVQNVNGTIELVAGDSLNLGASSSIAAKGDASAISHSPGGFVVLKSGRTFTDISGSVIGVSGQQGGQDGIVEIFGNGVSPATLQSTFDNSYARLINPYDITLSSAPSDTSSSNPRLNVGALSAYTQIDLHALDNIELGTYWSLFNPVPAGTVSLTAGNNIRFDAGMGIGAGNNWSFNLTAGAGLAPGTRPTSGNDGVYLNGDSYLFTLNGDIRIRAANEVLVSGGGTGGITTFGGGNINVTADYGDVYTGNNVHGYDFGQGTAPYYQVNDYLGGISTAAGGDVTISAGRDVISYLPRQSDWNDAQHDAGSGAFGSQPGNVTITAGRNVYGHYVVANGVGTITAGRDIGVPLADTDQGKGFALSLVKGSWNVFAPNGNIYVQSIRNPNGIFGEYPGAGSTPGTYAGYHYFNYDPAASVLLDAGGSVEITGNDAPQAAPSVAGSAAISMPLILPPSLQVITGSGDFVMDTSLILFPSPDQNLNLDIGGSFVGNPNGNPINLEMSDSSATRWVDNTTFGINDHADSPPEINSLNPVKISVGGDLKDMNLYVSKQAQISVGGNVINSGFVGQNLHSGDVTSIDVKGSIENSPLYSFEDLSTPIVSANPLQPGAWDSVFNLAINPDMVGDLKDLDLSQVGQDGLAYYLKTHGYLLFPSGTGESATYGSNPGFIYGSGQLGFKGSISSLLSPAQISALESGSITVLQADANGNPIVVTDNSGHQRLKTATYTFDWGPVVAKLDTDSRSNTTVAGLGYQIGGPGEFDITAASIDLGNTPGIVSYGFNKGYGPSFDYLEGVCGTLNSGGAAVRVDVSGDLNMFTSRICSLDGGNVTVNAGGNISLSQGTFIFPVVDCYGIWTSGHSDVAVTANGNINVGSGRIATFNGGDVYVESYNGDVNCGIGANIALQVYGIYLDPVTGLPVTGQSFGNLANADSLHVDPAPYGSGILAEYPTLKYQTPGGKGQPGNITVVTRHGNIVSALGGISQFALDESIAGGPVVTLIAGTSGTAPTPDEGNILLGAGGVVGGTINVTAQGNVQGLIISRQNANITVGENFSGTVLAGGSANFSGGGNISGTVVGIGGINTGASSLGNVTLLSQNVSVAGGGAQSTLATSATATAASQSAAQQSTQAATEQATGNTLGEENKKKKKKKPVIRRVGRVTVILSTAVPPR